MYVCIYTYIRREREAVREREREIMRGGGGKRKR